MKKIKLSFAFLFLLNLSANSQSAGSSSNSPIPLVGQNINLINQSSSQSQKWYSYTTLSNVLKVKAKLNLKSINYNLSSCNFIITNTAYSVNYLSIKDSIKEDSTITFFIINNDLINNTVLLGFNFNNQCNTCNGDVNDYSLRLESIETTTCPVTPTGCNLIKNTSFENLTVNCASLGLNGPGNISVACDWDFPTLCQGSNPFPGTPDIISDCGPYSNFVLPQTYDLNTTSNTGNICGGMFTYALAQGGGTYREYIGQNFGTPLVPGKLYNFSLYTKSANMGLFSSNFSAFFSSVIPCQPNVSNPPLPFGQQLFFNTGAMTNTSWQKYQVNFIATTAFNCVTLGNFASNGGTTIQANPTYTGAPTYSTNAYYFIDDVALIAPSVSINLQPVICNGGTTALVPTLCDFNDGSTTFGYSWSPNTSLSSPFSFSTIASPSVTTTYTLSQTINGSFGTVTNTAVVTVSVIPPPSTITPVSLTITPNIICVGSTATITASGPQGNFYLLPSNAVSSGVFTVSPSSTTIYTVVGNYENGCPVFANGILNVEYPTEINVNVNTNFACASTSVIANAMPTSLSFTWLPTGVVGTTVTLNPTVTTIYTVIATTSNVCAQASNTFQITYVNNCDCLYGTPVGYGSGMVPPSYIAGNNGNLPYFLPANIYFAGVSTFSNTELKILPNVEIRVANNGTLNILGSHLYACDAMWKGIVVDPGGVLNIINSATNTPLVEDAFIAVECLSHTLTTAPNSILNLQHATFNKNQIAIKIDNFKLNLNNYPYTIRNCLFTSRNIPFNNLSWPQTVAIKNAGSGNSSPLQTPYINNSNYPPAGLKNPLLNSFPTNGIYLNNVGYTNLLGNQYKNIIIGGTGVINYYNCFDNLREDITAINTNIIISNNVFQNGRTAKGGVFGKAIVARSFTAEEPPSSNNNQLLVQNATGNSQTNNRFYEKTMAIDVLGYVRTEIKNCNVYSFLNAFGSVAGFGNIGFTVKTNRYNAIFYNNNQLYNIRNAMLIGLDIGVYNTSGQSGYGRIVGAINIQGNTVKPHPTSSAANEFIQIALSINDPFAYNNPALFGGTAISTLINGNNFEKVFNGAAINNIGFGQVIADINTISLANEPATFSNPIPVQKGIEANQILNVAINKNNISGQVNYSNEISAIKTSMNQQLAVRCNTTANTYHGLNFNAAQALTLVQDNLMQNQKFGISLTNTASIGQQGNATTPTNNQWLGSWTNNYKTMTADNQSSAQLSKMYVPWNTTLDPNGNGITYFPGQGGVDDYFHGVFNSPSETIKNSNFISPSCRIGNGNGNGNNNPNGNNGNGNGNGNNSNAFTAQEIALMETFVGNNNFTNGLSTNGKHIHKNHVYRQLKNNPNAATTSTLLTAFYNQQQNTAINKYTQIEDSLNNNATVAAQTKINSLNASAVVETNYKDFYTLYLKTKNNSFGTSDSSALINLANMCPYTEGGVVYQARALFNIVYDTYHSFIDNCNTGNSRLLDNLVNDNEQKGINVIFKSKLYPNPNNGSFELEHNSNTSIKIEIYDILGKLQYSENIRKTNSISINTNNQLIKGTYFVKLYFEDNTIDVHRIIIQ